MTRLLCLTALLWVAPLSLSAQTLTTEQTPPNERWLQLSTAHFNVIFPKGLDAEAQRTANTLEHLYTRAAEALDTRPKKLPVLLINQNVTANGFVSLVPRRTVWFSTPAFPGASSLVGTSEWYNLLAVHEYRHVAQFSALNRGVIRLGSFVGGDLARSGLSFFSTPIWFLEGDAVGAETTLSRSGRGRLPSFDMHIRALLLEDIRYPYHKALHRSFRDFYPSHYQLGYALTTHINRHYDASTWANVLQQTSRLPFWPLWFSNRLKRETGLNTTQTYDAAMDELQGLWTAQQERLTLTPATIHTPRANRNWTNYIHPHFDTDGSVVAIKSGHSHAPVLVRLSPDGQETKIRGIDRDANRAFSVAAGAVAFSHNAPHPRFGYQSRSKATVARIGGGVTMQTAGTNLFIPELSPDGQRLAAVEFTPARETALVIYAVGSGEEVARFPSSEWISGLAWLPDGKHLAYIHSGLSTGKALSLLEVATGDTDALIPYQHIDMTNPTAMEGYVLFQTPYTGIDNIFAVNVATKAQYQVTSRPVGAFMPDVSADGTQLVFSDYTVLGHDVATMPLAPDTWIPLDDVERDPVVYISPLITEESQATLDEANIPTETYATRPYRRAANALRFHSWTAAADENEVSVQLLSTNLLNTLSLSVGPTYNRQRETWQGELNLAYARFFPILTLDASYGQQALVRTVDGERQRLDWTQTQVEVGVRVPLFYQQGIFTRAISVASEVGYLQVDGVQLFNGGTTFVPVQHSLAASRAQDRAPRDLIARNAQSFVVALQHAPFESEDVGTKTYGRLRLGLPGLGRHHGIALVVEAERNTTGGLFGSDVTMPRGYRFFSYDDYLRGSANYALPLAYPDLGYRNWFGITRLSANMFFDFAAGTITSNDTRIPSITDTLPSAGIEFIADVGAFELIFPLRMGFRVAYRFEDDTVETTFTFGQIAF
ncbi:MAG: hypothetical protein AAGJ10_09710 [Bacteroidota bacterium]